jgi:hypothetical protein
VLNGGESRRALSATAAAMILQMLCFDKNTSKVFKTKEGRNKMHAEPQRVW